MDDHTKTKAHIDHRKFIITALFISLMTFNAGCGGGGGGGGGDGTTGGDGTVNLSMTVSNLEESASEVMSNALINSGVSAEADLSPAIYRIALVNFWLVKDDNTEINLINPDEDNPTYTEDNPLIVDFSADTLAEELLTGALLPEGTYTGYKIQFLYIEMQFPVYFHLPEICSESDIADVFGWDISMFNPDDMPEAIECNFRLYFNAHGKYWKRDFVVNLNVDTFEDEWFWLRREVDGDHKNFFISVTNNEHPSGGAGPENTIDLFDDPEFWGNAEDYSENTNPIIISSGSDVGGLNATIEPFTVSGGEYNITVNVDVENTLNYSDNETPPSSDYTFHTDILDLGPSYGSAAYGDQGLHPFLPVLTAVSEKLGG